MQQGIKNELWRFVIRKDNIIDSRLTSDRYKTSRKQGFMCGLKAQTLSTFIYFMVTPIRFDYASSRRRQRHEGEEVFVIHEELQLVNERCEC